MKRFPFFKQLDEKDCGPACLKIVAKHFGKVIELINGIQEIKLHNAEKLFRWFGKHLQAKLFRVYMEKLSLRQYQDVGSCFINELKNILITVISAKLVFFIRDAQDARISLESLSVKIA